MVIFETHFGRQSKDLLVDLDLSLKKSLVFKFQSEKITLETFFSFFFFFEIYSIYQKIHPFGALIQWFFSILRVVQPLL